ncbi:hypothetical protein [Ahrensia kielensis]|uniref:hypothetical protein n=1 Tax=Ahrensia kielensis TaxID=76980 RepID=UPI000369D8D5|nr:hypothetical protein [Ahrensia kielensis]
MITRYALFEGTVKNDELEDFREAFLSKAVPQLRQMPNVLNLTVSFSEFQDEGAPQFPIIMAVTYSDIKCMTIALESPEREKAKMITEEILSTYFEGRVHHHVTESHNHEALIATAG